MSKFKKLEVLNVSEKTAPFSIRFNDSLCMVLTVAFAGKDNAPYWDAYLEKSTGLDKKMAKKKAKAGKATPDLLAQLVHSLQQEQDRLAPELYAAHILRDWHEEHTDDAGVVTKTPVLDGEVAIEVNVENARDLVGQLPSHVFDDLKTFCQNVDNFVEEFDAEATVKNS